MDLFLNVYDFGAVGDGKADDTQALQDAIDAAEKTGKAIYLLPGHYSVRELFLKPNVVIRGEPRWGYGGESVGNTVLMQRDEDQECLMDITNAGQFTLDGISLYGTFRRDEHGTPNATADNTPGHCHGIMTRPKGNERSHCGAFRIQNCKISGFGGHGAYLDRIGCFSVRNSSFGFNRGDGIRMNGWDAFLVDNWFSGNGGAGFGTEGVNCSVTMTGCRIEWNAQAGISILGGTHYNITGNYIDRSGGPAIRIVPRVDTDANGNSVIAYPETIACTGNLLYRSGKYAPYGAKENSHAILDGCSGLTFVGNVLRIGSDDNAMGRISPDYGMILHGLRDSVVSGNTMYMSSLRETLIDQGGHGPGTVIEHNVGTVMPPPASPENHGTTISDAIASDPWNTEIAKK